MKKLLILGSTFAMGLCAVGIAVGAGQAREAKADATSDALATLIGSYDDAEGQYTKKSTIFIKQEAIEAKYFHAGAIDLKRTTYYDDDILLMGDINGGFDTINGGYANVGSDMIRFHSNDGVGALSNPEARIIDYTVKNKQMVDYFFGIEELRQIVAASKAGDWTVDAGVYTHAITDLTLVDGEYNDAYLKAFQYFAAPMLLQDTAYVSPASITIAEYNNVLSIKIYGSETDKTILSSKDGMLAEARVYKGIVMPGYYLIGDFNGWAFENSNRLGDGDDRNYAKSLGVEIPTTGDIKLIKLNDDGYFDWIGKAEDQSNIWVYAGHYDLFASKDGFFYAEKLGFQIYVEEIQAGDAYVYLYDDSEVPTKENAPKPGVALTSFIKNGNNYVIDTYGYTKVGFIVCVDSVSVIEIDTDISNISGGGCSVKCTTWQDQGAQYWIGVRYWGSGTAAGSYDIAYQTK